SPDDHLTTTPYCRMRVSHRRRVSYAGGDPTVGAWIVSPTRVKLRSIVGSTPDDHFTAGPDCRVRISTRGRIDRAGDCPAVRCRIVSAARVQRGRGAAAIFASPHAHHAPGPQCRVRVAPRGRICGAGGYPSVCVGIVSPTSVQTVVGEIKPAPDDHFTAGPYGSMRLSALRRVSYAGGDPTVGAWIVSPARVKLRSIVG